MILEDVDKYVVYEANGTQDFRCHPYPSLQYPLLVSSLVHSSFENRDRDSIARAEAAEGRSQTYANVFVRAACLARKPLL